MSFRRSIQVPLFIALLLAGAGIIGGAGLPSALAAEPATLQKQKQDYESRANNVRTLSDALRRESQKVGVDNSTILVKVDNLTKEAGNLAASGEYELGRASLDEAYRALRDAIATIENARPAAAAVSPSPAPTAAAANARQRDLVERDLASTEALLDALKRQNTEKHAGRSVEITAIEATKREAMAALAAGHVDRAETLIHDAYSRAKAAIASLQPPGETAVVRNPASSGSARGVSTETARTALEARLKTIAALSDALRRVSAERGINSAAVLAKSEQLTGEASRTIANNPDRAMTLADEAYALVRTAVLKARGN